MSGGYESSQADVAASTSYGPNPTLTLNPAQLFEGEQQRGTASGSPAAAYMGVGLESGLVEVADKVTESCPNVQGAAVAESVMRRIVPAPVSSHPTPSISIASLSTISDNASQWDDFLRSSDIGPRSQDWKLAQPVTDRAVTLCSIDIMNSPTRKHLEVLLAVCNMLLYATMPFLVRESDLGEYFDGTGVQVPDLAQADLGLGLEHILSPEWGKVTREKLDSALAMTGFFVSAIQRTFATIATDRDPARLVREVQDLWRKLDRVHGAIQRLHRSLKSLPYTPAGCEHLNHALDYDLLLVVRMDARMVDIVNLTHVQLLARRERLRWTPHEGFLEELIAASEKRMRKCLRLLAFYAKIFTDSLDKHIVYHLFIQVEVIPWVGLVVQRVGEEGGPTSAEYEMSPVELDWFSDALEVACFYMPLASVRLQELQRGRDARRFSPIDSPFLPTPSPGSLQRSPGTSTSSGSPGEHSTSSSHSPPLSYFPSSHSPPHNYPATSPSGVIGNSFDFAFGNSAAGAYSPGGNQGGSLSVDYSDFGGAGMLGQSPQGQDGLPVFDDKAWQKDELTRW
ncbi:hypothetical protein RQP46_008379 [Phenoliferia psychrophenolica]